MNNSQKQYINWHQMGPNQLQSGTNYIVNRGVSVGWAGWAIAHPGFGRIEVPLGSGGAPHYYLPTQFWAANYSPVAHTWVSLDSPHILQATETCRVHTKRHIILTGL